MKALKFKGNGKLEIFDKELPKLKKGEVMVKVKASAICGSDVEVFFGETPYNCIPGHEFSGQIVKSKSEIFLVGDRIVCSPYYLPKDSELYRNGKVSDYPITQCVGMTDIDGGFAEYVILEEQCCLKLSDSINFEEGSLILDNFATPLKAINKANITLKEKILVLGLGAIGKGVYEVLKFKKFDVEVFDIDPNRMPSSEKEVYEYSKRNYDVIFDCTNSDDTMASILSSININGRIVILGHKSCLLVPNFIENALDKNISIITVSGYYFKNYSDIVDMVASGFKLNLNQEVMKLDQMCEAMQKLKDKQAIKIVLVN